jgi:dihydrofolate synthase/folylpolyglutamate synthase
MTTLPRLEAFPDLLAVLSELTNYESEMPRAYSERTFDLSRAEKLLDRIGRPERAYRSAHVAGTKGKGSTCATIASIARASGLRTGLYTSPHLIDIRERIRIDGEVASDELWLEAARVVIPEALALRDEGPRCTFFEITTAIALEAFRLAKVSAAVLETGLGGRLDATNVVHPAVAVVTQIGLDHTALLGKTKELIAAEKAAIAKPGVPLLSGVREPGPAAVIEQLARARQAPLERLGAEITAHVSAVDLAGTRFDATTPRSRHENLHTPLAGAHQAENAALAIAASEHLLGPIGDDVLRKGLAQVRWRGRLDLVRPADGLPPVLVDAAHDPTSAARVVEAVRAIFPRGKVVVLFAIAQDKEVELVLDALAPLPIEAIVTKARTRRAADPHALARGFAARGVRALVAETTEAALALARERARDLGADLVLAVGSVYLAGETLDALGEDAG